MVEKALLILVLIIYLLLTFAYSVINPLFEAPDEQHHFYTVLYIAENGRLPIANLQEEKLRQEAAQPPLYYLFGAALIRALGIPDDVVIWQNEYGRIGDASALTNINWGIHDAREAFPWQGYALSAHVLRLFSVILGLGTLLGIYASGRLIWPQRAEIALLATALVAFLPQFNFLHSTISNDTLVIFLCTAALWQVLRLWLTGVTNGRLLLLGVTVGLAILSKNAGTLLLVYSMAVLTLLWLRDSFAADNEIAPTRKRKMRLSDLFLMLLPALLIGGWLWGRNWLLYQDGTAANVFVEFAGGDRQASIIKVLREWQSIWPSLFAVFGWFNVRPPQWVYWIWYGIIGLAVIGTIKEIRDWRLLVFNLFNRWFIVLLLAGWVLAVYTGLFLFMLKTEAAQGRLLFPAILPLALGLAYGLSCWRWRGVYMLVSLLALLTSLVSLFGVIRPAYALPPIVDGLPSTAVLLDVDVGQNIILLGAELEVDTAVPNDEIWVTLYWQTIAQINDAPQFTLDILGHDSERIGHTQGYHGRGLYPANLWSPGQIIADRFVVRLNGDGQLPVLASIFVGLVDGVERVAIGTLEVEPEQWSTTDAPTLTNLGDGIELTVMNIDPTAVSAGDTVTIDLQWRVTTSQAQNYTTLVHLAEVGQVPLATADDQPLNGRYPTRLWESGELINDSYTLIVPLDLQNGRYPLWIGMYDAESFARLPLSANNERQANDVFQIGWLTVTK